MAKILGSVLIEEGFDIILTDTKSIDELVGRAAVEACGKLNIDPRERIRTYLYQRSAVPSEGFGVVLKPIEKRYQEARTFFINEAYVLVALMGGKGTSDCIQKAILAKMPVFPIAIAGGSSAKEWEK